MDRTIVEGSIEMTPDELAEEAEKAEQHARRELEEQAEAKRLQELAELQKTILHRGIGDMDRTVVEGFIEVKKKRRKGSVTIYEDEA